MKMLDGITGDFSVRPLARLEDLVGNENAMGKALRILRWQGKPPRMALFGPSGSGKSTIVNYICALAHCHRPTGDMLCGKCDGCERFLVGRRETGLFVYGAGHDVPLHYLPINCRNVTPTRLHFELECMRGLDGMRLIHFEEGANLKRLGCDESLTDILDDPEFESCHWFMTAVTEVGLDPQFCRRWGVRTRTTPPDEAALARLLAKRCHECKIRVDHPGTLQLLARKSWCVVGQAMALLSEAMVNDPPLLTRQSVEKYPLPSKDPWKSQFLAD